MTPDDFENELHAAVGKPRAEWRTRSVGHSVTRELVKEPGAHRTSWAEAFITLSSPQSIKLTVKMNLMQGDLNAADYGRLSGLALTGIRRYWSRTVTLGNTPFVVNVQAIHDARNGIDAKLRIEKDAKYARSYNMAILWLDARFIYNPGYFKNPVDADQDFMETCAHEFGHSVLMEFGGIGRSWTHEGSTSILQSVKGSTPGYPSNGEINLMRYYDDAKQSVTPTRLAAASKASEFDVKSLIWMSKLTF